MSMELIEIHFTKTFEYKRPEFKCATFTEYPAGTTYFVQPDIAALVETGGYGLPTGRKRILQDDGSISESDRQIQITETSSQNSGSCEKGHQADVGSER